MFDYRRKVIDKIFELKKVKLKIKNIYLYIRITIGCFNKQKDSIIIRKIEYRFR